MPLYSFECARCGDHSEHLLPVAARNEESLCLETSSNPDPDNTDGFCLGRLLRIPSVPSTYIGSTDRPTRGQG